MEQKIYRTYFLSAGEANAEGDLSLTVLVSKIIEIATEHANSLGIGNPVMTDLNAGWILSRLTIQMEKFPTVNNSYVISTWIEDFNRHFSTRCFKIESLEGDIYGYARSIWLVMDSKERTNLGLSHLHLDNNLILGEPVPISRQEKHIPILPETVGLNSGKKFIAATCPPYEYTFNFCDLDSYRHVNTIRYVAILLNQFSLEEHDKNMVSRLELSFLHEASFGLQSLLFRADDIDNPLNSSFQLCSSDFSPLLFARLKRVQR